MFQKIGLRNEVLVWISVFLFSHRVRGSITWAYDTAITGQNDSKRSCRHQTLGTRAVFIVTPRWWQEYTGVFSSLRLSNHHVCFLLVPLEVILTSIWLSYRLSCSKKALKMINPSNSNSTYYNYTWQFRQISFLSFNCILVMCHR